MNTPPLLMGGALLFWGWQTGMLPWGILLSALLEGSRFIRARWEFSDADLRRIADLCWALFVGAMLLLYSTGDHLGFVFKLAQWLPFCFFPLMLAQAYGNRARMPLSVFWWLLRRSPASGVARKSYNISFCYFAVCLLATSASTRPTGFFYPGITLLVALALTCARPRRVSWAAWLTLLLLVATAGQFSHMELKQMQNAMESALGTWIADFFGSQPDNRECQTKIGYPGPITGSGRIELRLHAEPGSFVPSLLREATWDAYRKETWSASNNEPFPARSGNNDNVKLLPTNAFSSEVEIARYYENGEGTLALPHGTFEIDDLDPASIIRTNRLGVATIGDGPGLLDIKACFGPGLTIDGPPCERDLMVDTNESPTLARVVADLKLKGMTDRQKIRAIDRFFAANFTYSLNPPRHKLDQPTWLSYFLLRSRTGHCEYFATATVLLLRQAGVNARYVTGFSVPESARHGDTYLVRERDRHAWALAYVRTNTLPTTAKAAPGSAQSGSEGLMSEGQGIWEQVDTTPSSRGNEAAVKPPFWEPASDALSNVYFQFSKWRWSRTSIMRYANWLLAPLILYLLGRILLNQRRHRPPAGAAGEQGVAWPGLDSELYLINRQLEAARLSRLPNEPLLSWQQRLERAFPDSGRLRRIFHLHRSLRFDPRGLKKEDRETLRSEAQRWLAEFTAKTQAARESAHN